MGIEPEKEGDELPPPDKGHRLLFLGGCVCGLLGLLMVFNPVAMLSTGTTGKYARDGTIIYHGDTTPLGVVFIIAALFLFYMTHRVSKS